MDVAFQASVQNGQVLLAQLQETIGSPEAQGAEATIRIWQDLQRLLSDRLIPSLNDALETLEIESSNPTLETQLRSLNPEVTRLVKLLQIDWQFWQAARQAPRIQQRQQQLLKHLEQLGQLLAAIGHHLSQDSR